MPDNFKKITKLLEGPTSRSARSMQDLRASLVTAEGLQVVEAKYEKHLRMAEDMWEDLDMIVDSLHLERGTSQSWQEVAETIMLVPGFGAFGAKEATQDLLLTEVFADCVDLNTWTAIGPGGRRGIHRIAGREVDAKIQDAQLLDEYRQIFEYRERLWPSELCGVQTAPLQLHDVQFQGCEWDKYCRETDREQSDACHGHARGFEARDTKAMLRELVDHCLCEAGDSLHWEKLRDKVSKLALRKGFICEQDGDIGIQVLVSIPPQYLSRTSEFVTLPSPKSLELARGEA